MHEAPAVCTRLSALGRVSRLLYHEFTTLRLPGASQVHEAQMRGAPRESLSSQHTPGWPPASMMVPRMDTHAPGATRLSRPNSTVTAARVSTGCPGAVAATRTSSPRRGCAMSSWGRREHAPGGFFPRLLQRHESRVRRQGQRAAPRSDQQIGRPECRLHPGLRRGAGYLVGARQRGGSGGIGRWNGGGAGKPQPAQ